MGRKRKDTEAIGHWIGQGDITDKDEVNSRDMTIHFLQFTVAFALYNVLV